jgi:hypothetical protein
MEDVLNVYQQPYDPTVPVICMDETNKQLVTEKQEPIPAKPGQLERPDYQYERGQSMNIFMFTEPLKGWRSVHVTEHRTRHDWALEIKNLVDVCYPNARRIKLVMDNLNTHSIGSLYETFTPYEASRLAAKLEIHHTPKHGSWLNIAEIELSALSKQCLDRHIPTEELLKCEIGAWEKERNASTVGVDWQFTTADARVKLKRLYPRIRA